MNELIWQAQNGDKKAMSTLIENNLGLVWNVVKRFNNRGYEKEDLFQLGCMGFVKAIKNFNLEYKTQLSTYAVPMILGEIKRFLRDDGTIKVSRSIKEIAYKIETMQNEIIKQGREQLSISELAKELKISAEDIILALDSREHIESLDKEISEDDSTKLIDRILINDGEYNEIINKMAIEKMLDGLTSIEKKVIIYRYFKEKTQIEVSKIFSISQVQVSRIEKRALQKMRES